MAATTQMEEEEKKLVKVIRISAVAPAIPTKRHKMFLSNLDFFWLPFNNVQRLLFYRVSPADEYSSMVDGLKKSLSSALVYFYPLAGRLDKEESGRPELDCNDKGVEFIEASIDLPFDELEKEQFQYKPFFQSLVPMAKPFQQQENYNSPLLSVQVTALKGEGICIGTTLHHVIADGNSFWHFMKSWAECSRGLVPISKLPHHNRTVFKRENNQSAMSFSFKPHEVVNDRIKGAQIYKLMPGDPQPEQHKTEFVDGTDPEIWVDQKTELVYSTFCFTEKMIADLKERSRASSSFVAVAAHFWRTVTRAREVEDEQRVMFSLLADFRGRVKLPLISNYFGNCLSFGFAQTTAKKLLSEDVGFAAGVIEELVKSCTTEEQFNYFIEWMENPERALATCFNEIKGSFITNVISSPRFPVYEIDYGWGKPLNVQAASMTEIGSMVLFGAKDGGGSIAVSTCLRPHHMNALSRLFLVGTT